MHAVGPLQLNIILFSGTALSNNDQPAILRLVARFCGSAWCCVCREAPDETIAVDRSLNEAAKSYVRASHWSPMNESGLISKRTFARWKVYNRKATLTDNDRLFGFLGWFASEKSCEKRKA
jgi:hypothetical protein